MSEQTVIITEGELRVTRDVQPFYSNLPELDPRWRFTDAAGHEHRGDNLRATTVEAIIGRDGCGDPGCCGETWDVTELRCDTCAEPIRPGTRIPTGVRYIVTGESYFLNDEPITKEQFEEIVSKYRRAPDEQAQADS